MHHTTPCQTETSSDASAMSVLLFTIILYLFFGAALVQSYCMMLSFCIFMSKVSYTQYVFVTHFLGWWEKNKEIYFWAALHVTTVECNNLNRTDLRNSQLVCLLLVKVKYFRTAHVHWLPQRPLTCYVYMKTNWNQLRSSV